MDMSLADLNQKIDLLTDQVAYLTEQAQLVERQRQERAELIQDLKPIANHALSLTIEQLEEVQEYIDLSDLLRLVKRIMRNGRNIEKAVGLFESLMDLLDIIGPLTDEAFSKAIGLMAELEHKGYFTFARNGMYMADNLVLAFNETVENPLDASYKSIFRQLRDPSVRRGLALTLNLLRALGAQPVQNEKKQPETII
jgi:uncharacterized protein YjgD (DUF1641 family)